MPKCRRIGRVDLLSAITEHTAGLRNAEGCWGWLGLRKAAISSGWERKIANYTLLHLLHVPECGCRAVQKPRRTAALLRMSISMSNPVVQSGWLFGSVICTPIWAVRSSLGASLSNVFGPRSAYQRGSVIFPIAANSSDNGKRIARVVDYSTDVFSYWEMLGERVWALGR